MNYQSVVITRKGGPEVLQVAENPLREPGPNEVRVRVLCTGVGFTDVVMRYGYYPYAPKIPFAPGYDVVGVIDALGDGVTGGWTVGQRVASLTVTGGYAEYVYLAPDDLVAVPDGLDPAEAVCLVLNYATAYQLLHREAQVEAGQTVFANGASGGVGQALLELGRLAGVTTYGLCSPSKFGVVEALGGVPIDYTKNGGDYVEEVRARTPGGEGVDAALDGLGGSHVNRCFDLTKHGGHTVLYGFTTSVKDGHADNTDVFKGMLSYALHKVFPAGRKVTFYGVTALYRKDKGPFHEDLPVLFDLLREGKIKPRIAAKLPLTEAARANAMLEAGGVGGKIVLVCTPEGEW